MSETNKYIHALRFSWLNRCYDIMVRITTREGTFKRQLVQSINQERTKTLLDLACGTGTLAIAIKQAYPDIDVSAVDGDESILEQAKKKSASSHTAIQWQQSMAQKLPFANNSFDAVTSTLFFHHLDTHNKLKVLKEIQRVLKPGGELLIADWGATDKLLLRTSFYLVQWLDGFETTADNIEGKLPTFIEQAGFNNVVIQEKIAVPLGSIDIIRAICS